MLKVCFGNVKEREGESDYFEENSFLLMGWVGFIVSVKGKFLLFVKIVLRSN